WTEWYGTGSSGAYYNYDLVENGRLVHYNQTTADYQTDVLTAKAVDFINRSGNDSFFAYIAPPASHPTAIPANRHLSLFPNLPGRRAPSFNEADVSDKP